MKIKNQKKSETLNINIKKQSEIHLSDKKNYNNAIDSINELILHLSKIKEDSVKKNEISKKVIPDVKKAIEPNLLKINAKFSFIFLALEEINLKKIDKNQIELIIENLKEILKEFKELSNDSKNLEEKSKENYNDNINKIKISNQEIENVIEENSNIIKTIDGFIIFEKYKI